MNDATQIKVRMCGHWRGPLCRPLTHRCCRVTLGLSSVNDPVVEKELHILSENRLKNNTMERKQCHVNMTIYPPFVRLTKPHYTLAWRFVRWSKTKAAISLSDNCSELRQESENIQPEREMNPERKREGWMEVWHHEETLSRRFRQRGGHGGSKPTISCMNMHPDKARASQLVGNARQLKARR